MNNNLKLIKKEENIYHYDVFPGASFNNTLEEALQLIKDNHSNSVINYHFNNIPLSIDSKSTIESVQKTYNNLVEKRHIEYTNSNEYKEQKIQFEKEFIKNKQKTEAIFSRFDESLTSKATLIKWIGEFADAYEKAAIVCDKKLLAQKMKSHGYALEFLNETEKQKLDEKQNLEIGILANAYKAFSEGNPVHHVAYNFSLKYAELVKKENVIDSISSIRNKKLYITPNKKYDL